MNWSDVLKYAQGSNLTPPRWVDRPSDEWRQLLTEEEFRVTRRLGTEKPFSGEYCSTVQPGRYGCLGCGSILFDSSQKFESSTGWPSFTEPVDPNLIRYAEDKRETGPSRIEVRCNVCNAHLGHVFPDGPEPSGLRYCINSAALLLMPEPEPFLLRYDAILQGTVTPSPFTLIFVFRMNCPGCFLYGFDQAQAVCDAFDLSELQVLGLSTAFGNIDDDPTEATQDFLHHGILSEAVEQEFESLHRENRITPVRFPVLLDQITPPEEFLNGDTLQWFYSLNPNYPLLTTEEIKNIVKRATLFYNQFPQIAHTFALNFLPGTPCYILLNSEQQKIGVWLGHQGHDPLVHKIRLLLDFYSQ